MEPTVDLREFQLDDQPTVKALVLAGLAEHWGADADPSLNPDLNDIAAAYAAGTTLVAIVHQNTPNEQIVGTGTVVPRPDAAAELVRMSVAAEWRRHGIGRRLVDALIDVTRAGWSDGNVERVILETTASWTATVGFYERCGFAITHYDQGEFGLDGWFQRSLLGESTSDSGSGDSSSAGP